jgi:hypothetical protein
MGCALDLKGVKAALIASAIEAADIVIVVLSKTLREIHQLMLH